MFGGSGVLRLRGIDQSQEFLGFKAFRCFPQKVLQFCGGLGVTARVILSDGRLKFVIQILSLLMAGSRRLKARQKSQENRADRPVSHQHDLCTLPSHLGAREWGIQQKGRLKTKCAPAGSGRTLRGVLVVQFQSKLDLPRIVWSITS